MIYIRDVWTNIRVFFITPLSSTSWVMYTREPPLNQHMPVTLKRHDVRGQFNWTHTVLKDSTFPLVYGSVAPRMNDPPTKDYG